MKTVINVRRARLWSITNKKIKLHRLKGARFYDWFDKEFRIGSYMYMQIVV